MKDEDLYLPKSDFLTWVSNEEIPFDDSEYGRANLRRLIDLTTDEDTSNRDWATMLLGHYGPRTSEVRDALLRAADDEDEYVRGEAVQALVERDRSAALRLTVRELAGDSVCYAIFQAATELADPSLVPLLEICAEKPTGVTHLDGQIADALEACRGSYRFRSSTRRNFPVAVFGSASTNSISRGYL
ncbi:MAG TPA: HEAT repeat domain-containing protein [Sphingomicrobium sp.]|nr:HEAT repeat domain-containing protein [Sphingomicrobium sp.]